jgi:hypothetical protein
MSNPIKLTMIVALALSWLALHHAGVAIVDRFGLIGALAAYAGFYCVSFLIDR